MQSKRWVAGGMCADAILPRGQRAIASFPRFGLLPFATRFPAETQQATLHIAGDVATSCDIDFHVTDDQRVDHVSDFHCVITWTRQGLRWSGMRFADFHDQFVVPLAQPHLEATFVVLRGQDGARTSLPLKDLRAPDVMLADRLDGEPLSIAPRPSLAAGSTPTTQPEHCRVVPRLTIRDTEVARGVSTRLLAPAWRRTSPWQTPPPSA